MASSGKSHIRATLVLVDDGSRKALISSADDRGLGIRTYNIPDDIADVLWSRYSDSHDDEVIEVPESDVKRLALFLEEMEG